MDECKVVLSIFFLSEGQQVLGTDGDTVMSSIRSVVVNCIECH